MFDALAGGAFGGVIYEIVTHWRQEGGLSSARSQLDKEIVGRPATMEQLRHRDLITPRHGVMEWVSWWAPSHGSVGEQGAGVANRLLERAGDKRRIAPATAFGYVASIALGAATASYLMRHEPDEKRIPWL